MKQEIHNLAQSLAGYFILTGDKPVFPRWERRNTYNFCANTKKR